LYFQKIKKIQKKNSRDLGEKINFSLKLFKVHPAVAQTKFGRRWSFWRWCWLLSGTLRDRTRTAFTN